MNYKELIIWQEAMDLTESVYLKTGEFPKLEMFGLAQQSRRSATSVASNIAEGCTRQTTKDYIHFLYYAKASLSELETQMIIAQRLGYLGESCHDFFGNIERLAKRLNTLIRTLKDKTS